MIVDFHTHTYHSYDSLMDPRKILRLAKDRGLDAIVINDHNTIKGGLEASDINPYKDELEVIVGAEIATDLGDITGLYLKEEIHSRNFSEVVQEIKNQKGIVVLNHPYYGHKLSEINYGGIDLIEGFNSRLSLSDNLKAVELAKREMKPIVAGSDAHLYAEIARCKTYYHGNDLMSPVGFEFNRSPYLAQLLSQYIKVLKTRKFSVLTQTLLYTPKYLVKNLFEKDPKHRKAGLTEL